MIFNRDEVKALYNIISLKYLFVFCSLVSFVLPKEVIIYPKPFRPSYVQQTSREKEVARFSQIY